MAKVIYNENLGENTHFYTFIQGQMSLEQNTATTATFEAENGARLEMTGTGLDFDENGNPISGAATSATFYDAEGNLLIEFKEFSVSAVPLFQNTAQNGWFVNSTNMGKGFAGTLLDGNDTLTGSTIGDRLTGLWGDDTINGLGGDDFIFEFDGNGKIDGGDGKDYIDAGKGKDKILGGADDDEVWGGLDDDTISGGTGNDELIANEGNDKVNGDDGNDVVYGDAGNDLVNGGRGNDDVIGGSGKDKLNGGDGADRLQSGTEKDLLTGGKGDDIFFFDFAESTVKPSGRDLITDFSRKDDLINLTMISEGLDLDISFIGTRKFTGDEGDLRYAFEGKGKNTDTVISIDFDGDKKADWAVEIDGKIKLATNDFIL